MKIAITGATGFVGQELVRQLGSSDTDLKCWRRSSSDSRVATENAKGRIEWIEGELADSKSAGSLVKGCDAVVHSGLWRSDVSFQANEPNVVEYARVNILGTLELIEAAKSAGVSRFVFVSTCAVHDQILDDRPLDESHPLWAKTHYGAHKAAIEKFVHSYGMGDGFPICAIRPTGIYGVKKKIEDSKWYRLVQDVVAGKYVNVSRGGKEVHVSDVAGAIQILLHADEESVIGQSFSCYDRYVSEFDVATISKRICESDSEIIGQQMSPKHEIDSSKIKALGMKFGGEEILESTIRELVRA